MAQAISELPAESLIPIGLGLLAGILLWVAGRRILVGAFATIGFGLGGVIGWLVGESVSLGVSSWVVAAVGALLLACVGALASRIVVAGALAVVLGIAAPLGVLTFAQLSGTQLDQEAETTAPQPESLPDEPDEITDWLQQHDERESQGAAVAPLDLAPELLKETLGLDEGAEKQIERIDRVARRIAEALKTRWDATPATLRPTMIASAVIGILAGALLGTLARGLSATVVTAFGGSLLWLSCAWVLVSRLSVPDGLWLPGSSASWLALWMITSVIGLSIQWTFRPKRADKSAS